jgi:hypothetical protein
MMPMKAVPWLRSHKNKIVVHCLIISSFLLYAFFVEGSLFHKLSAVENEASLCRIELPSETDNITYNLDQFPADTYAMEPEGWAFIEGESSEDSVAYLVLRSEKDTYVFETESRLRQDVTRAFGDKDLDWSGFAASIPTRMIEDGEYAVGIYIEKDGIEALEYTDHSLIKGAETVGVTSMAPLLW